MAKILVIDDDASFREVLGFNLGEVGIETDLAADGQEGLDRFDPTLHHVVLTDLKMPRLEGLEVLRRIKVRSPNTVVVVITAFGTIEQAVDAIKGGAFDFIPKPCSRDHLELVVNRALDHFGMHHRLRELEEIVRSGGKDLIFRSAVMQQAVALIDRAAASDATVLVTGESGTGKELFAQRLHRQSPRVTGPFVVVNCAAIPGELLESELFGHAKGAFTGAIRRRRGRFEVASGGTLFLDEVSELPLALQTKLLRALQERVIDVIGTEHPIPVDVRIIAATNQDLSVAISTGTLRQDLYYRLNVLAVHIPPLRDRPEDILLLAEHFIRQYSPDQPLELAEETRLALERHPWPGNVRELENVCQRMALLAEEDVIGPELFSPSVPAPQDAGQQVAVGESLRLPAGGISLMDLERDVIQEALRVNQFNQTQTARFLRIHRHILLHRIRKYGIKLPPR